jgi:hypothetical protein
MKAFFAALSLTVLLVAACTDSRQPVDDLQQEVLDLHDTTMLKMDALYLVLDQLKPLKDSLSLDSTADPAAKDEVLEAMTMLRKADDAMMDWMAEFEPVEKDAPVEESMKYLEGQKESIIEVDRIMNQSIANGERLLEKMK